MDQNSGKGGQPQQDEKGPVRGVAVGVDGFALLEPSHDGDGGAVQDGKGGVVAQQADGMPERVDFITLEPADADHHQGEDNGVAGHDQQVVDPLHPLGR